MGPYSTARILRVPVVFSIVAAHHVSHHTRSEYYWCILARVHNYEIVITSYSVYIAYVHVGHADCLVILLRWW